MLKISQKNLDVTGFWGVVLLFLFVWGEKDLLISVTLTLHSAKDFKTTLPYSSGIFPSYVVVTKYQPYLTALRYTFI